MTDVYWVITGSGVDAAVAAWVAATAIRGRGFAVDVYRAAGSDLPRLRHTLSTTQTRPVGVVVIGDVDEDALRRVATRCPGPQAAFWTLFDLDTSDEAAARRAALYGPGVAPATTPPWAGASLAACVWANLLPGFPPRLVVLFAQGKNDAPYAQEMRTLLSGVGGAMSVGASIRRIAEISARVEQALERPDVAQGLRAEAVARADVLRERASEYVAQATHYAGPWGRMLVVPGGDALRAVMSAAYDADSDAYGIDFVGCIDTEVRQGELYVQFCLVAVAGAAESLTLAARACVPDRAVGVFHPMTGPTGDALDCVGYVFPMLDARVAPTDDPAGGI